MADQLISGLKALDGATSQTQKLKALAVEPPGKTEDASGKDLPPAEPEKPRESDEITRELKQITLSISRDLRFIVDLKRGEPIIQVLDSETGEVIRQIPADSVSDYSQTTGVGLSRLIDTMA